MLGWSIRMLTSLVPRPPRPAFVASNPHRNFAEVGLGDVHKYKVRVATSDQNLMQAPPPG